MKVQLLNKIAAIGTDKLDKAVYELAADMENPDAIMVRSAAMHDMAFGDNLKAIARAGAGVNNIPIDRCSEQGIVVFNTPGANANGVKELAICALLLASRNVVGGIKWAESLQGTEGVAKAVEAGKSKFAGCEIAGKTLGVIGLGAIGGMVAGIATHLKMDVVGCDPFISIAGAWHLNHHVAQAKNYDEIYAVADYITLHVPATPDTKNMINAESIAKMKDGVKIINLSRADLVDAAAVKEGLASGKISAYVTDFPTEDILGVEGVVAIPHLGASTEESEDNCAVMAAVQLDEYLRYGNIKNSVNFPNVDMPLSTDVRVCVLHANVPAVLSQLTSVLSAEGINIEHLTNKSKGNNAYTVLDISAAPAEDATAKLAAVAGVYRVRVIK
ncbi:MAG: phosphoglycerate dehydrogenase [Clostridia bacterium]|nr:phosphoglycerate dehydrogenase [Clostridia bacterium]